MQKCGKKLENEKIVCYNLFIKNNTKDDENKKITAKKEDANDKNVENLKLV